MKHDISLKNWLSIVLGALLFIQLFAFFLVGRYAEQTMRRNAVRFNDNLLQVYMEKLDGNIEGISRFLSRYASSQEAISVLARSTDESERFFAVQDIMRQLENGAFLYDNFSGLFVYSQGVEELTLCLSQYFRYMLGSSAAFVALGRELKHVSNYMQIQQMRRPGQLVCTQEIEQNLADALLPPLVVQTFMENSIKYGEPEQGPLEISLLAEPVFGGPEQMRILICDNGKGYSAAVLRAFAQGKPLGDGRNGGIGIENVRRRLELGYGGRAALHISNGPGGGAVTEILIPLCMETPREDADDDFTSG